MRFSILALLALMTLCSYPFIVNAATHNWYFSNNANGNAVGNDTTGNGSISRPWKTLSKAQKIINTLGSGDTANLYFDRGDKWTVSTGQTEYHFRVNVGGPRVHIDAYGSGNKPVFDGSITDFSTTAFDGSGTPAYRRFYRFFDFRRNNCSVSNVEIKNVYGNAIFLKGGDYFTLSNSEIHNIGYSAILVASTTGGKNNLVEYNKIYLCQQLHRYGKVAANMWGGAVHFTATGHGAASMCKNNMIRYNLVFDIYGEGIIAPNSTIEYNVIGDTSSIAIDLAVQDFDALTAVARYNFVMMSDWSSSIFDNMADSAPHGIRVFDELTGGDNSAADISIYGNIVINRGYGIQLYCYDGGDTSCGQGPYGSIKIYNNTIIDSRNINLMITNPDEFLAVYIYNNSSILYDRLSSKHANMVDIGVNWDIDYNHFWTKGGSSNVPNVWRTNCVISDPELPGEPLVDWDGLTGSNYYNKIDFGKHLNISPDSHLVSAGKILGSGYSSMFLSAGTDFSKFKFKLQSQPKSAKWCIGTIIPEDIDDSPNPFPPPPSDLTISIDPN